MIKAIRDTLFWLLFVVLLAMMIDGAFGAPAPAEARPEADDDTITVIVDLDQIAAYIGRLEAAVGHWYNEAQRLKTSKGCS